MNILAIETSCDDTCAAIVKAKGQKRPHFKILSNIVSSQVEIHKKWGGIYPSLAKREHQRNLPIVLRKALREAGFEISNFQFPISKQIPKTKLKIPKIDAIAVTVGPGLEPCLWTGINFARELAKEIKLPLIPVNHIEAHIFANLLPQISEISNSQFLISKQINFPAVCLVVSGGHTQLILMKDFGKYKILGETRDDAAGECFDKAARILGLGYPGGPAIAAEAAKFSIFNFQFSIKLPRPMIYQKNYDFSFSGLKTAVLYQYQKSKIKNQKYKQAMCKEIQQAIIDVLTHKTIRAAKEHKAETIILGGGVTANEELKRQFKVQSLKSKVNFLVPPKNLCTDNAAMIAVTAYYQWLREKARPLKDIEADANLRIC